LILPDLKEVEEGGGVELVANGNHLLSLVADASSDK